MRKKRRKLGAVQQHVYQSLIQHKGWSMNCGWLWDYPSSTERHMERLVALGYARREERPNNSNPVGRARVFYFAIQVKA